MPTKVPIGIFMTARTVVDRDEVKRWLDFIGVAEPGQILQMADDGGVSDPALNIALAGKRCYKSFEPGLNPNVTKIRKDYGEYFDNILKSGHGSVLEHSVYTFAIENVSRVFTGEMNRHRAGWAISEASMRFIRFGENIPYWEPDSIQGPDVLTEDWIRRVLLAMTQVPELSPDDVARQDGFVLTLDGRKQITREVIRRAFHAQQVSYRKLESIWADELAPTSKFAGKKQITSMMRRIVGMGCATGGKWTGNIRALRHVITMRAAPEAEEEMIHVFTRIAKMIRDREPHLFGDFEQDDGGYWRPKYVKV